MVPNLSILDETKSICNPLNSFNKLQTKEIKKYNEHISNSKDGSVQEDFDGTTYIDKEQDAYIKYLSTTVDHQEEESGGSNIELVMMANDETFYQGNPFAQNMMTQDSSNKKGDQFESIGMIKHAPFSKKESPYFYTGCLTQNSDSKKPKIPSLNNTGLYASEKICLLTNFGNNQANGHFKLYNRATKGQLLGMCVKNKLKGAFSLVESNSGTFVKGQAVNGKLDGICKLWVNIYLIKSMGLEKVQKVMTDIYFDTTIGLNFEKHTDAYK